ncbi:cytochrome P450 [Pendulispora brunnea]|uniref:Cytochrome P450 n=1 Tax=Pendulispora brunnea TaxID=2905690 RepID=A0ABZ2K9X1_9BACT
MPALPPGPRDLPAVQMLRFLRDPFAFLETCTARYGDVFTARFSGMPPIVYFHDPEAIREVFASSTAMTRAGEANAHLKFLLGPGSLLLLDGKRHERERRLLMSPFGGDRIATYLDTMVATTHRFIEDAASGQPFSLRDAMQSITLDVILSCIFGAESAQQRETLAKPLKRLIALAASPAAMACGTLFDGAKFRQRLVSNIAPAADRLASLGLGRAVPFGELARAMRDVQETLREHVREHRAAHKEGRADVLSMLIEARDEEGRALSDDDLRDELLTMLVGGHESTATTLTFALYTLCSRPDLLDKATAELARVTGHGPLTSKGAKELRYIEALIKETLRLYGATNGFGRKLAAPLRVGGFDLPEGVLITASSYVLHRNPRIWPDPHRFDPERFLDRRARLGEFIPFGGGARTCLGMNMAMFEAKVIIATLLEHAKLRVLDAPPVRLVQQGIFLGPSSSVPCVLEKVKAHSVAPARQPST